MTSPLQLIPPNLRLIPPNLPLTRRLSSQSSLRRPQLTLSLPFAAHLAKERLSPPAFTLDSTPANLLPTTPHVTFKQPNAPASTAPNPPKLRA